jgi:hypothetical protein
VWAVRTCSFYGPRDRLEMGNTLHFLRSVNEDLKDIERNVEELRDIVKTAQKEAAE